MREFHAALLCICCALLLVGLANAPVAAKQLQDQVIRGAVIDPAGKPAVGATVLIVSRQRITTAVSGKGGKFSIVLTDPRRGVG